SFASGNLTVILFAGFETTADGLTFTLYLLAKNQDIQERLRREINEKGTDSEYLEMVRLKNVLNKHFMKLISKVWMESLRLYSPVIKMIAREACEDVEIGDLKIEKGTLVQAAVWQIHYSEHIYEEPYAFKPERFSSKNRKNIHPAAFLPFGVGPRICLGMQLANFEAKLLLTKILTKFKIEMAEQTPKELELECHNVIMQLKEPLFLKFVPL
ncbi:cytochrome P450 3A19-like protein, partial [Dinothrombium tinctorium]